MSPALTAARMSYAAAAVAFITYGMYVVLFGICLYFQLQHQQKSKGRYVLIIYTCAMFVTSTIYLCFGAKWSEIEFVESTADTAAFASALSSQLALTKNTASVVNIWLADSLILYRTYVIWGGSFYILIGPFMLFLGAVASAIALLIETAKPGAVFGMVLISDFGTAFWSISLSLNVISTTLIAGKLMWHQRSLRQAGIPQSDQYMSIAAILAESAALYSISGLIYIPLFARDLTLQYPFSALFNSAASIAPNLIVLRMALGVAANDPRSGMSTTMNIASMPESQYSRKQEVNTLASRRSIHGSGSTLSPSQRGFGSVRSFGGENLDVYAMDHFKRGDT